MTPASVNPAEAPAPQNVFVTGLVRCGSSWVGQVLAGGAGTRYVYEPFNPSWTPSLRGHFPQHSYLAAGDEPPPRLARVAQAAFAGRQGPRLYLRAARRHYLWSTLRPARRVLVKDPTACLASGWLHARYQPRMLLITRHPCGYASSMHLHGWIGRPGVLLRQQALMAGPLAGCGDLLRSALADPWLALGAFWAAVHRVLLPQWQAQPGWLQVAFEDLCQHPREQFPRLAGACGLAFSPRVLERTLGGHEGLEGDSGNTRRDTARMATAWQRRLSAGQVDAVMGMVRAFGLDYPSPP